MLGVFEHPNYPVSCAGKTTQEVIKKYPLHLKEFILEQLANNLDPLVEKKLRQSNVPHTEITPWDEAIPWEVLAKTRIEKYKKAGLVLRGARLRENMSQIELVKKSKVHQNEISKIENGKRTVGEKVAKRLAKVLHFDYMLLLEP